MNKKKPRPNIASIQNHKQTMPIELFQNDSLRPIIKQLNSAWQSVLLNYCAQQGVPFSTLNQESKKETIINFLSKNLALKNQLFSTSGSLAKDPVGIEDVQ